MRIYFAGKIGKQDWRSELFDYRPGGTYDNDLFNLSYTVNMGGGVVYGGPFFVSCDHGCGHGPSSHGVNASERNGIGAGCGFPLFPGRDMRDVFEINNQRIKLADYVFAYLDDLTAYGTLVEIGFAYASGIPVAIALSPKLERKHIWYAVEAARFVYTGTPRDTFLKFCRQFDLAWRASVPSVASKHPHLTLVT
jgi:hypothetical protein